MKKYIHILLIITILLSYITPIQTKTVDDILIYSDDIPYVMVARIKNNQHIDLYMITTSLALPKANDPASYQTLNFYNSPSEFQNIKNVLNQYYNFNIKKYMYLNMHAIQQDFQEPYTKNTFQTMKSLTSYFQSIKKKITLSSIFHVHQYLETNIEVKKLYSLFKSYYKSPLHITYHYPNYLLINNSINYPLDYLFS